MKPSQVSILVIRLASAYLLINKVPYFIYLWVDMSYQHARFSEYLWLYVGNGLEIVFSVVLWMLAPAFSRSVIANADEVPVKLTYSEAVAIGLSIISIIFIYNGAEGLAYMLLWDPRMDSLVPSIWRMLDISRGMPLELPLGILILLFTPRLAILLENRLFDIKDAINE